MGNASASRAAEMIGQRLRRDFYAEEDSAPIWLSLSKLSHAELDRRPWRSIPSTRIGRSPVR